MAQYPRLVVVPRSTHQRLGEALAQTQTQTQTQKAYDEAVAPGPTGPTVIPFRPPRQTEPRLNRPDICRRGGCLEPVTDDVIRLCAGHLAKYTPEAERAAMRQAALLHRRPSA